MLASRSEIFMGHSVSNSRMVYANFIDEAENTRLYGRLLRSSLSAVRIEFYARFGDCAYRILDSTIHNPKNL